MLHEITRYFPDLPADRKEKLLQLEKIYSGWNSMINVISRKDMENFMIHHVLHSLSIAKVISFLPGTKIMDAGTGGGFPGIPLAIMFPEAHFTLIDSIEKKIKVVTGVAKELDLNNITPLRERIEEEKGYFDFIISRAVTGFSDLVRLTAKNLRHGTENSLPNGIISLKGGDLTDELKNFGSKVTMRNISDFFDEPFFGTKKIVYLPF